MRCLSIVIIIVTTLFGNRASLHAQPTLLSSTTTPVAGEAFVQNACGVTHFTNGAAGAGILWDFSGLASISADTISYLACSGTGLCDSFPGSSLASVNAGNYQFYAQDTNVFAISGKDITTGNIYYSVPEAFIFYPCTYNTATKDSFSYMQPSLGISGYGTDSFTADGYGTLILPSGTYSNTLRVHTISIRADSSNVSGIPTYDTFRADVYSWYIPFFHSPLLSMYYDFGSLTGTGLLAQVFYYTLAPSVVPSISTNETEVTAFPNPAMDKLTIGISASERYDASFVLADLTGRTVFSYVYPLVADVNNVNLSLPDLNSGIYILSILKPDNTLTKKMLITIVK